MNLNQRLEFLPEFETNYSSRRDALLLAAVLVVGLTFVTPALSLVTGIPTLVFVAIVGAGYGLLILVLRQLIVGFSVGLIVTAMFAANVPLLGSAYSGEIVGHLEPSLWLFYAPLAGIIVYLAVTTPLRNWVTFSRAEWIFAVFVVWTVLSASFGAVTRFDVALWFSVLMFQALVVFAVFRYVVQSGILSFRTVIEVFALGVCAHAAFGLVQFANGESFGFSYLGAGQTHTIATFSFGPLSKTPIGTYISGFTGMSFSLAGLIVLTAPVIVALALRTTGWRRWVLAAVTAVLAAVLRATGSDAAKGGFIVAMVLFVCAVVILYRRGLTDFSIPNNMRSLGRTTIAAAFVIFAAVFALFTSSSDSGAGSAITNIDTSPESVTGNSGASKTISGSGSSATTGFNSATGSSGGAGVSGGSSATHLEPSTIKSILRSLSIPGFDIATLGGRLQQYVIGLDLFITYPIFGIGGMNFNYISTDYGFSDPLPIHNIYISLLAGTGLPGFLLYVGVLVMVLWSGWQAITAEKSGPDRLLVAGVLAGIVGVLAVMFWAIRLLIHTSSIFPFWIFLGAIVGKYQQQSTTTNA